jgi:hypothetical protein
VKLPRLRQIISIAWKENLKVERAERSSALKRRLNKLTHQKTVITRPMQITTYNLIEAVIEDEARNTLFLIEELKSASRRRRKMLRDFLAELKLSLEIAKEERIEKVLEDFTIAQRAKPGEIRRLNSSLKKGDRIATNRKLPKRRAARSSPFIKD